MKKNLNYENLEVLKIVFINLKNNKMENSKKTEFIARIEGISLPPEVYETINRKIQNVFQESIGGLNLSNLPGDGKGTPVYIIDERIKNGYIRKYIDAAIFNRELKDNNFNHIIATSTVDVSINERR